MSPTVKLECPPVQDSPTTPATPVSPLDITAVSVGSGAAPSTSSVDSRANVTGGKRSRPGLVPVQHPGAWKICKDKNKTPTTLFEPGSCEIAKKFLLNSVKLPRSAQLKVNLKDTPKSSKVSTGSMVVKVCHGCHMQMVQGQGAHLGSRPGKNHCTLPHSINCPGGIVEDETWRSCPLDYRYHGQVVPVTGFLNTLNQSDFSTSTPVVPNSVPGSTPNYPPTGPGYNPRNIVSMFTTATPRTQPLSGVTPVTSYPVGGAESLLAQQTQLVLPHASVQPDSVVRSMMGQQIGCPQPLVQQAVTAPVQSAPVMSTTLATSIPLPNLTSIVSSTSQVIPDQANPLTYTGLGNYVDPVSLPSHHPNPVSSHGAPTSSSNLSQDQLVYDLLRLNLQQRGEGARPKDTVQPKNQHPAEVPPNVQQQVDVLRALNQQVMGKGTNQHTDLNIADLRALYLPCKVL